LEECGKTIFIVASLNLLSKKLAVILFFYRCFFALACPYFFYFRSSRNSQDVAKLLLPHYYIHLNMVFGSGRQVLKPPERGVFALDHDGECKDSMKVSESWCD
jgi:hypothetical protein